MSGDNDTLGTITPETAVEAHPNSFRTVPCHSSASHQGVASDNEGGETTETGPPTQIVSRIDAIDLEPEKAFQKLRETTQPFRREASVTDHILVQVTRWHESLFYRDTSQEQLNDLEACISDLETDALSIIDATMRLRWIIELARTKGNKEYEEPGVLHEKVIEILDAPPDLTSQSEKMANLQKRYWEVGPEFKFEGQEPGQEPASTALQEPSSSVGVTTALGTVSLADE